MTDFEQRERAEFNQAISYLNRLNVLFSGCDQASINLDVFSWYHSILALMRELSTWMDNEQRNECDKRIINLNHMLRPYMTQMQKGKTEIPNDLYMQLHGFEIMLRDVANKAGLLMKMADDAFDAMR